MNKRAVNLQNAVANLARHALHAREEAVVEHNASAHTHITGDKNQRLFGLILGKFILAERRSVGLVLHVHWHIGQAHFGQRLRDLRQKIRPLLLQTSLSKADARLCAPTRPAPV